MNFNIEETKRLYRSGIIIGKDKIPEGDFITFAYFTFLKCLNKGLDDKDKFRNYYNKALRQGIHRWIAKDSELENHNYFASKGHRRRVKVAKSESPENLVQHSNKVFRGDRFAAICNITRAILGISGRDWIIWKLSYDTCNSKQLAKDFNMSRARLSLIRISVRQKLLRYFESRGIELTDFYQ